VAELFYMLQLTQRLAITPDVQVVVDPPLNSDEGVIGVFGMRGRLSF
jgi:porin